jgi:hypothetical protein
VIPKKRLNKDRDEGTFEDREDDKSEEILEVKLEEQELDQQLPENSAKGLNLKKEEKKNNIKDEHSDNKGNEDDSDEEQDSQNEGDDEEGDGEGADDEGEDDSNEEDGEENDADGKKKQKRRSKNDVQGRDHKCNICDKTYLSYPALYTHMKNKHAKGPDGQPLIAINSGRGRGRPKKNAGARFSHIEPTSDDFFKTSDRDLY